jgi:hypothetical protein
METGDNGEFFASSMELIGGKRINAKEWAPANSHLRDFLDCVWSRNQPRANAGVACQTHIVCHAVSIAKFLDRKVNYDPVKNMFIGDQEANRLRCESLREPWQI